MASAMKSCILLSASNLLVSTQAMELTLDEEFDEEFNLIDEDLTTKSVMVSATPSKDWSIVDHLMYDYTTKKILSGYVLKEDIETITQSVKDVEKKKYDQHDKKLVNDIQKDLPRSQSIPGKTDKLLNLWYQRVVFSGLWQFCTTQKVGFSQGMVNIAAQMLNQLITKPDVFESMNKSEISGKIEQYLKMIFVDHGFQRFIIAEKDFDNKNKEVLESLYRNGAMYPDTNFSKHRTKLNQEGPGAIDYGGMIVEEVRNFDLLNVAMEIMFLKQGENKIGWERFIMHGAAYPFYLMTQLYSVEFLNHLNHLKNTGKGEHLQHALVIITQEFPEFLVKKMNDHAFPRDLAFEVVMTTWVQRASADKLNRPKFWEDDQALAAQIEKVIIVKQLVTKKSIDTVIAILKNMTIYVKGFLGSTVETRFKKLTHFKVGDGSSSTEQLEPLFRALCSLDDEDVKKIKKIVGLVKSCDLKDVVDILKKMTKSSGLRLKFQRFPDLAKLTVDDTKCLKEQWKSVYAALLSMNLKEFSAFSCLNPISFSQW